MVFALEGLRGIAAMVVALYHGWPAAATAFFGQGWLCVDLFFVISGFVMSHVYRDKLASGSQVMTFAIRRFGRLYPLHLVTLMAFILAEVLLQLSKPLAAMLFGHATNPVRVFLVERWSLLSNLLLLHGMGLPGERIYNNASWSISTEIWAYVLFAVTSLTLRGRMRVLVWAALAAIGAAALYRAYGDIGGVNSGVYFFRCVYGFFLGALLPPLRDALPAPGRWLGPLQAVGAAASLACFFTIGSWFEARYFAPLAFALLVYAVSFDAGAVARILQLPSAQFLGKLSYSIYMTHGVVLIFFNPAGQALSEPYSSLLKISYAVLTVGVSVLTYRWIEEPWRRRFQGYAKRAPASASAQRLSVS